MKSLSLVAAAAFVTIVGAGAVHASSSDAWAKFNAEVEQKCTASTEKLLKKPQVAVDPVGSESFGLAIVYGRSVEVKGRAAFLCVVNKKTGVVEIGTEMSNDLVRIRKPKSDDKDDGGEE